MATPLSQALAAQEEWYTKTQRARSQLSSVEFEHAEQTSRLRAIRQQIYCSAPLDDITRDVLTALATNTAVVTDDDRARHAINTTLVAAGIDPDDIDGDMETVARAAGIEYAEEAVELPFNLFGEQDFTFDGHAELEAKYPAATVITEDDSWFADIECTIDDEQWDEVYRSGEVHTQPLQVTVCTLRMIEEVE